MKGRKKEVYETYDRKRGVFVSYGEWIKRMKAKEKKEKNVKLEEIK